MERATQDDYITHRSKHEKIIMHQPSWSYASSKTQPPWLWGYEHGKSYTKWLHHRPIKTQKIIMYQPSWSYASSINQPYWRWSYQHGKSYTRWLHHTLINTRKNYHISTLMIIRIKHNPTILALGFGVMSMERATKDGYITHRSIHEKITMYQPSWSYASSITQPSWRWSCQHGKSYARWLHHTPINTQKDYHASTLMITRIKHNPTILALELSTWKELHKIVTSHTNQYTKRLSCINPHDHTHQA